MKKGLFMFVGIILLVLGVTHLFVWETIISFFSITSEVSRIDLGILFGILAVSFVAASVLSFRYDTRVVRVFYVAAAGWAGVLNYATVASALAWVLFGVLVRFGRVPDAPLIGGVCFAAAAAASVYGFLNARRLVVKRLTVPIPGIPPDWKGRTAVMFSDVHLGHVNGIGFLRKILEKTKELNPDVVFIPGDLFDGVRVDVLGLTRLLNELHPPFGTYFSIGNHDEFEGADFVTKALEDAGVVVVRDTVRDAHGMQIIGIDYRMEETREDLLPILRDTGFDPRRPSILLHHAPVRIDEVSKSGVSLQLAGHTHKGQIFPFDIATHFVYKGYDYGFHTIGSFRLFTSCGVGTWGPPLRVGSTPELIHITFE